MPSCHAYRPSPSPSLISLLPNSPACPTALHHAPLRDRLIQDLVLENGVHYARNKSDIDFPWLATLFISDHDHPIVYCVRCNQSFPNNRLLEQHKENSNAHWVCAECRVDFGSIDSRREHYIKSRKHYYCRECDRLFEFDESTLQHMEAKHRAFPRRKQAGLSSPPSGCGFHFLCRNRQISSKASFNPKLEADGREHGAQLLVQLPR